MTTPDLNEELSYLRRSLEDLEREHAVGDVSERDYERLRARYETLATEVEQALGASAPAEQGTTGTEGAGRPEGPARSPVANRVRGVLATKRARLVTGWTAFTCFGLAAVLLVLSLAGVGPFASTPPLSLDARVQIMLAEASVLGSKGEVTEALATYDRVLALAPEQPVALADGGWIARLAGLSQHEAGLVRNGDAEIAAAVQVDPGYAIARAYDGIMLYGDQHEDRLAVTAFLGMLDDHPSATLLWSVRSYAIAAYHAAGVAVPGPIANATKPRTTG
ncbi:MAG: hypothetical protein ACLPYW_16465 [Acidimicrobiales bacterium]